MLVTLIHFANLILPHDGTIYSQAMENKMWTLLGVIFLPTIISNYFLMIWWGKGTKDREKFKKGILRGENVKYLFRERQVV